MITIAALATPLGRSGIGVVRLSGADALPILRQLVSDDAFEPSTRVASLRQIRDADDGVLDEALVTYFKAPNSFTGEDVVEVSCHGSPVLLRQVIDRCLVAGARLAEPGEFTLRALANGRMNLTEAEAIRDLINAQTLGAARQAVRQMRGEFSHQLQPIKDRLLDVIVILESALEFVEDDLPEAQADAVRNDCALIRAEVAGIAATFKAGKLVRDGIRVAIVGRPNVGKSSLFNALLRSERAIVTDIAGTTRDQLHERFTIDDIPISLIDTAGLRDTSDTVEIIGVERSRRVIGDADLVIVVISAADPLSNEDRDILKLVDGIQHIIALNKIDIVTEERVDELAAAVKREIGAKSVARLSAKTGHGIDEFESEILRPFSQDATAGEVGFLVSDARHFDLLSRAISEIDQSMQLLDEHASEEIVLVGLHNALRYLGEITGETTTEDMLTRIFSTFCIGK